ncbi:MAG: helix-turn-helix domain-containing protein [Halofilum sp. (in: g-proteobacteria)]|nr:helix-turn-helix domain-containing protein [Halofilum sp. (in: g-proteobacteria)]
MLNPFEVKELAKTIQPDPPRERGDVLFRAGDPFDRVYVVRSGCVRTAFPTANGHEQILGFHVPGNVIGFDADPDSRRCCTATVLERTSLCVLDYEELERASERLPGLRRQIHHLLRREIASGEDHVLMMGRTSAYARVAFFLQRWSERMEAAGRSPTILSLPMRREDIASYLGLVTETASRAFSRLHEDGIVAVESRRVEILDHVRLQEVTGG